MQTLPNPYSISKSINPNLGNTDGSDYANWYELTAQEEDEKAKDHPQLPYQLEQLPQIIGTMVTNLNNMASVLEKGVSTVDSIKGKPIDTQIDLIVQIKDKLFDLNNSLVSLKL